MLLKHNKTKELIRGEFWEFAQITSRGRSRKFRKWGPGPQFWKEGAGKQHLNVHFNVSPIIFWKIPSRKRGGGAGTAEQLWDWGGTISDWILGGGGTRHFIILKIIGGGARVPLLPLLRGPWSRGPCGPSPKSTHENCFMWYILESLSS